MRKVQPAVEYERLDENGDEDTDSITTFIIELSHGERRRFQDVKVSFSEYARRWINAPYG